MSPKRRRIEAKARRYGRCCWLCGLHISLELPPLHPDGPSLDHIVEKRNGGAGLPHNTRLAHRRCNIERHRLFPHLSSENASALFLAQEAIAR